MSTFLVKIVGIFFNINHCKNESTKKSYLVCKFFFVLIMLKPEDVSVIVVDVCLKIELGMRLIVAKATN